MMKIYLAAGVLALSLLDAGAQAAEPKPAVQSATTQVQDWSLRCDTRADAKPPVKICGLMSTVTVKDQAGKEGVATVIVLRSVPGGDKLQLSMELPLSVLLPDGVKLQDNSDKEVLRLPFMACRPSACEAGAIITADQAAGLTRGDYASALYMLQTGKAVQLGFSTKGLAEGLRRLTAETAKP